MIFVCLSLLVLSKDNLGNDLIHFLKMYCARIPWRSSGLDSELPLQGAQVPSLVGELRSCMLRGAAKSILVLFSVFCIVKNLLIIIYTFCSLSFWYTLYYISHILSVICYIILKGILRIYKNIPVVFDVFHLIIHHSWAKYVL